MLSDLKWPRNTVTLAAVGIVALFAALYFRGRRKKAVSLPLYTIDTVVSKDGTKIGFRKLGKGPALILVHGGMRSSVDMVPLAAELSDSFTLYIPDRRGRGMSGAFGDNYSLQRDVEDLQALLKKTGAQYVFGHSSGALVSMWTALASSTSEKMAIKRLALYEPPFPIDEDIVTWLKPFDEACARSDLASALLIILHTVDDPSSIFHWLPRWLLLPFFRLLFHLDKKKENPAASSDELSVASLVPTMHYDGILVKSCEGTVDQFKALLSEVALLSGSQSQPFLEKACAKLALVIPRITRVRFPQSGHNAPIDQPREVAAEVLRFFSP